MPVFVPVFWKTLIGQKWCALFFHNLNRTKNLWNHYFSARILFLLLSNNNQILHKHEKSKTLIGHIGVCLIHKLVLFQKLEGDAYKNTIFLEVSEVFGCCFVKPFFLLLPFCFWILWIWLLTCFFLLFCCCFINQFFYVVVVASCCFVVLLAFFLGICLVF